MQNLQTLELDYDAKKHAKLLRAIPTLKTINFKPAAEVLAGVIPATDVDRRAAEWVLALGGSVRVNGAGRFIKAADELPREGFTLTWVSLRAIKGVTDVGLANLKDLSGLTFLDLNDTAVTDAALPHLKNLQGLKDLYLGSTEVTDGGLAHLRALPALTHLYLGGAKVADAGLAYLKDFKGLKHIDLYGTMVADAGLHHLKNCPGLTEVVLGFTQVTNTGLAHLKDMPGLKHLGLQYTTVTDTGLEHLKDCRSLEHLNLGGTKVTDDGLIHLKNLEPQGTEGSLAAEDRGDREGAGRVPGRHAGVQGHVRHRCRHRPGESRRRPRSLPKERFSLTRVNLRRVAGITDAGLVHLKDLKALIVSNSSRSWSGERVGFSLSVISALPR